MRLVAHLGSRPDQRLEPLLGIGCKLVLKESGLLGGLSVVVPTKFQSTLAGWIGGMTIQWNECQAVIFMIFHEALGTGILRSEAVFFALRSDGSQRDVTSALLRVTLHRHPDLLDRTIRAIADFGRIAGKRNDFIHAIWHFSDDSEAAKVWLDVRKNLRGKDPIEEIKKLIAELEAIFATLTEIRVEIEDALKKPANALAAPPIPGLLLEQPQLSDEQAANSDQALLTDGQTTPIPPHQGSAE